MKAIAARCFPIPEGIDIFHLSEEIEASEMTAKEAVMSVDKERTKLEKEAESLNDLLAQMAEADANGENVSEEQDEVMDRLTQVRRRLICLASIASFSSTDMSSGVALGSLRMQLHNIYTTIIPPP